MTKKSQDPFDFQALVQGLADEVNLLAKTRTNLPIEKRYPEPSEFNQIERRVLIRSVFSFTEALAFGLKMLALNYDIDNKVLTLPEKMLASECTYELDQKGEIEERPSKLKFVSNLKFSFRILSKAIKSERTLQSSGPSWDALLRSVKVRDRLMHPKHQNNLMVIDSEIRDVLLCYAYINKEFFDVFQDATDRLRAEAKKLTALLNKNQQ
jgi:hypothetical protein